MEKEQGSVTGETIGSRILEICELVGGKRKLANMVGISESQLYRYVTNASQPTIEPVVEMAKASGVSLLWLATGEGSKFPSDTISTDNSGDASQSSSEFSAFADEYALIPGYSVQVSAGNGTLAQDSKPVRHLAFRRKWLKWRGFCEKDLAIVWAKGDSMEPVISDNNTLVVHLGRTKPVDGGIYVIRNGDQLWVKRVQVKPGAWLLLSDNAVYPPFEVPMADQHNFQVVGQVVHISKDIGS